MRNIEEIMEKLSKMDFDTPLINIVFRECRGLRLSISTGVCDLAHKSRLSMTLQQK